MREMLLLGAGASVEAQIPTANDMTERMLERFEQGNASHEYTHVLRYIIGGLVFQKGISNENPFEGVNVEDLFNAIQTLANRGSFEASPFVTWHHMVDELDRIKSSRLGIDKLNRLIYQSVVREIISENLNPNPKFSIGTVDDTFVKATKEIFETLNKGRQPDLSSSRGIGRVIGEHVVAIMSAWFSAISQHAYRTPTGPAYELEQEFAKVVSDLLPQSGGGRIFEAVSSTMIQLLIQFVWIDRKDSARVKHLEPILNLLKTQQRLTIATLNYDNTIELLAESHNVPCNVGIEDWSQKGHFQTYPDGLSLLKLHGSIDWLLEDGRTTPERPLPFQVIRQATSADMQKLHRPAVIFGGKNKLTAKGPYLDLLQVFERELNDTDRLTVVGYSFRDEHVNEYIGEWINSNPTRKLRIINGPDFRQNHEPLVLNLRELKNGRLEVFDDFAGAGLTKCFGSI
jgi:hypothetical protein